MYLNTTKRQLCEGKPVFGIGATLGSPLGAEILALAGFDFVNVDNQHGSWTDESMLHAFRSICVGGATPFTRVSSNDSFAIGRALDRGALGILVPLVTSPDEARAAADAVRYPPHGKRSFGPFGCDMYGADYVQRADEEIYLGIQLESMEAVERADEIMAVEGIDGCWIGPNDLAMSMGADVRTADGKARLEEAIMAAATGPLRLPSSTTRWQRRISRPSLRLHLRHSTNVGKPANESSSTRGRSAPPRWTSAALKEVMRSGWPGSAGVWSPSTCPLPPSAGLRPNSSSTT